MFFYDFFRWVGVISGLPAQWIYFTRKVYYEDKAVQGRRVKGGALIISNHFCPLDFVLNVALFFPRKLYVVASEDAFRNNMMRFLMKFWGGIEANRKTKSVRFIIESVKTIKEGHLVQIFPEGHNTPDGNIHTFYPSYIAIASRANAPIIPVISDGNYGLFKRVHLIIGKPIYLKDYIDAEKYSKEDIMKLNDLIFERVLSLRAELDRRIQADRKPRKDTPTQ